MCLVDALRFNCGDELANNATRIETRNSGAAGLLAPDVIASLALIALYTELQVIPILNMTQNFRFVRTITNEVLINLCPLC